jgi:hypothetical protein
MANKEPLIVRKSLLILPIPGIIRGKVIIEDFYILSCIFYIYKKNSISVVLYIASWVRRSFKT